MKAKWIEMPLLSDQWTMWLAVYASDKQPPCYTWLSQFFFKSRFIPKQEFHLWGCDIFLCDLFYCPGSSGHGCPSTPSPCHQLWQSQPLFLQCEAAFFQRDDLLCLYRGWHWGRNPARGLDSTHRMLWTKSTSCHPNSAATRMCAKHTVLPQKANLRDPSVHDNPGSRTIITAKQDWTHHSFL